MNAPNTQNILDPYYRYLGMTYISVLPGKTEFGRKVYYPIVSEEAYLGTAYTDKFSRTFSVDNESVLREIAESFKVLCEGNLFFDNRFDNDELRKHSCKLDNEETGYPCDCYEIRIGNNFLRFFSTERGFDALSILRLPILESLTDEQRNHPVVRAIQNITA